MPSPSQVEQQTTGGAPNELQQPLPQDQYGTQPDQSQYPNQYQPPAYSSPYPYAQQQPQSPYGTQPQQQPNQYPTAQERASTTSLAEQQQAESSSRFPRSTPRTTITQNAPDVDWDYAVIQRLDPDNLKTVLVPFDLGKLVLQHDASQDLELQAGDVVSILSEADVRIPIAQQTKLVKLEGEFVHAGLYTVQPGETLRQLVERAGGLTPNAYLYGSEFTRESTRAVQQARIDEYVQSLDLRIQRGYLNLAASGVNTAQDLSSGGSAQNGERELISRLRQIRATGRIVLEFRPNSAGAGSLPGITMEDGDRFVIPHVPASINIVGAVNDQNSFLYATGRRVGAYLQLAGGLTKDADRRRSFVIRANGEVVGYNSRKGLWGNQFDDLTLFPGDTIVIPEKTFKPSALRGVLDWSQLFSQFALGAASLAVIQ
jgi:protein involved in polysaccharide export with SLBB domain